MREWQDEHGCDPSLKTNEPLCQAVSAQPYQARKVTRALEASGLDANNLELELTESVVVGDGEAMAASLRELTALGVNLATDDFGTSYPSFTYLKRCPASTLKTDRQAVCGGYRTRPEGRGYR